MLNTQEHYDLIAQFERVFKIGKNYATKEDKAMWAKGRVFCHDQTNELFLAYRHGYAYGKCCFQASGTQGQAQ